MKLSEIIKDYRTKNKLTYRTLADKCKISFQYLYNLENEIAKNPSITSIKSIADGLDLTLEELLSRADDFEINIVEYKNNLLEKTEVNNFFTIPYFKNLSAGCFDEVIEDEFDDIVNLVSVPNRFLKRKKKLIAFEINGESMNKIIPNNSIVVIEKKEEFKNGDIVVAQTDEGCTLKKYQISGENLILIPESTNQKFFPMAFSKNDFVKILGKVVWYCPPEDIFD